MNDRFDGAIVGLGTESGVRIVLGLWPDSPFGSLYDAMVERPDGHRVLVAPTEAAAEFISGTYHFDEVRVGTTSLRVDDARWTFSSTAGLQVSVSLGRRTAVGWLLSCVPRPLARTRAWCALIDPVARLARPGVRTRGTAGGGRREWYCALDERVLTRAAGTWDGVELGALRPIDPPVRFGFGSTPRFPCWVRVTTLVD